MHLLARPNETVRPRPGRGRKRKWLRIAALTALGAVGLTILLVLPWRWIPPPTTAFIVRERAVSETRVHQRWVSWDQISTHLVIAAVAAEDQKFPTHYGFDFEAIADAYEANQESGRVRGGSTISQQLAKNLFLWPGQNIVRKGAEAYFTLWIEMLWPKRRILEVYLNVAEFGPGAFGAAAASERLFGKPASELTASEAARLVAVLPSPKRMSAARPSEYVLRRSAQIEREVQRLGGMSYLRGL